MRLEFRRVLFRSTPLTGRTHQIRGHMEYIGCPILGDDKYFGGIKEKISSVPNKLYLHSYKIDLSELYNNKLVICAPIPEHFEVALSTLGLSMEKN